MIGPFYFSNKIANACITAKNDKGALLVTENGQGAF